MMLRVETMNSTYVYERKTETLVCVGGSYPGMILTETPMRIPVIGECWQGQGVHTTPVLRIVSVES